jgi:hypothetical protein
MRKIFEKSNWQLAVSKAWYAGRGACDPFSVFFELYANQCLMRQTHANLG